MCKSIPLLMFLCTAALATAHAEERRNWYDDPFAYAMQQHPHCEPSRGPFMTQEEARADAHHRIERGNSCILEGRCEPTGPYANDKKINAAVIATLEHATQFQKATLSAFTQHHWVTLEGCVTSAAQRQAAEDIVHAVPGVEIVINHINVVPVPSGQ